MRKAGLSTRAMDQGSNQDSEEGQPLQGASESGDPEARPLTAAVFRDTLVAVSEFASSQQIKKISSFSISSHFIHSHINIHLFTRFIFQVIY